MAVQKTIWMHVMYIIMNTVPISERKLERVVTADSLQTSDSASQAKQVAQPKLDHSSYTFFKRQILWSLQRHDVWYLHETWPVP